jgi:hypothetical protein
MDFDSLSLKWGQVKFASINSRAARQAFQKLDEVKCADMQNPEKEKLALCDVIDSLHADTVYLEWDAKHVSKEEAKAYVMGHGAAS